MPAKATIEFVRQSKIGTELTEEQCAGLSALVEVSDYVAGEVLVGEGATDDKLRVMRGITRFAHQVLHRTGLQMTELTSYIYKSKAKY